MRYCYLHNKGPHFLDENLETTEDHVTFIYNQPKPVILGTKPVFYSEKCPGALQTSVQANHLKPELRTDSDPICLGRGLGSCI